MPRIPDIRKVRQLIPPLSAELHKGQAGRVGVVGGSEEYTGAPYFSGIASMQIGADLCHIFCEPGAGSVIKTYSPDLIVHPYMRLQSSQGVNDIKHIVQRVSSLFPRLHVLVIGPGLSRDAAMQETARELIVAARQHNLALVLDADALLIVQNHPEVIRGYRNVVITPNVVEFKRLCDALSISLDEKGKVIPAQALSRALGGVTVVQKGKEDIISNEHDVLVCDTPGGLKRMGGQGDILSGSIATMLAWSKFYQDGLWKHSKEVENKDAVLLASWGACHIVRDCSRRAFEHHGRAVLTSHLVDHLGATFAHFATPT